MKGQGMRYANSKKSHHGIGVHPSKHNDQIEVHSGKARIMVQDVDQLVSLINIVIEAGREMGWPVVAKAKEINDAKRNG